MNLLYQFSILKKTTPAPVFTRKSGCPGRERSPRKLLKKSRRTDFGRAHDFNEIRREPRQVVRFFQENVPVHDYSSMKIWWDEAFWRSTDVAWPGQIPFWATSSGPSEGRQKFIPVSRELMRSIYRAYGSFWRSAGCGLPPSHLPKKSSASVPSSELRWNSTRRRATFRASPRRACRNASSFTTNRPPDKHIKLRRKVAEVAGARNGTSARSSDCPTGRRLFEKSSRRTGLETIHDLWPNLRVRRYGHGIRHAAAILNGFWRGRCCISEPAFFCERGHLCLFGPAPFCEKNGHETVARRRGFKNSSPTMPVCPNGSLRDGVKALTINDLQAEKPYALVISSNAHGVTCSAMSSVSRTSVGSNWKS